MPRIRRIQIKNFRSIGRLDFSAEDLTVFVGDNDCGKSNILRALNLFFNGETNPGQPFKFQNDWNRYAAPAAKQAKQIEIELDLELPVGYRATNGDLIRWKKGEARGLPSKRWLSRLNQTFTRSFERLSLSMSQLSGVLSSSAISVVASSTSSLKLPNRECARPVDPLRKQLLGMWRVSLQTSRKHWGTKHASACQTT